MDIIDFTDFSFTYATGDRPALSRINLKVVEGEIIAVCGRTGSGKSTLIRCMKKEITPAGKFAGSIDIGIDSCEIAVVFQDPDAQLVNRTVMDDLVFHMENLQYDRTVMRKRLAETAGFFGLEPLLHKRAAQLSGGQKQLVVLCAALMTRPKLLLLDEPAAQLDPIAAREFWDTVRRVHEEFGIAMVITEHRLDNVAALAHKAALMQNGTVGYFGGIESVFSQIYRANDGENIKFIPDIPRLSLSAGMEKLCFTPKEFKENAKVNHPAVRLRGIGSIPRGLPQGIEPVHSAAFAKCASKLARLAHCSARIKASAVTEIKENDFSGMPILSMKNVFYAYENGTDFVLKNLCFELYEGERLCILGGNGSGKTTLLKMLCKIIKPLSGNISKNNYKTAYMPQNIRSYFRFETIGEELAFSGNGKINGELAAALGISHLFGRHPFDLSGGEAQKAVLACMLSGKPDIIVMDEPTKGLDPYAKEELAELLQNIGAAIVMATHDISFAASFSGRCALLFDGSLSFFAPPRELFKENFYYTTSVNLGVRHIDPDAITFEEALSLWRQD